MRPGANSASSASVFSAQMTNMCRPGGAAGAAAAAGPAVRVALDAADAAAGRRAGQRIARLGARVRRPDGEDAIRSIVRRQRTGDDLVLAVVVGAAELLAPGHVLAVGVAIAPGVA